MWVSKKWLNELIEKLNEAHAENVKFSREHEKQYHSKPSLYCETCGCLLQVELAVAGEPIIRKAGSQYAGFKDVIHYPYFCKIHYTYPEHP